MSRRIEVFRAQPFRSRQGQGDVVMLRFHYDQEVIRAIKVELKWLRWVVRDDERRIFNAGGWLDHPWRCWFIEPRAWPFVATALRELGCELVQVAVPDDVARAVVGVGGAYADG